MLKFQSGYGTIFLKNSRNQKKRKLVTAVKKFKKR